MTIIFEFLRYWNWEKKSWNFVYIYIWHFDDFFTNFLDTKIEKKNQKNLGTKIATKSEKNSWNFYLHSIYTAHSSLHFNEYLIFLATKLQQHEFFYYADAKTAEIFSGIKETQSIRVYKDDSSYKFDEDTEEIERTQRDLSTNEKSEKFPKNFTANLQHWILRERFPKFVKVTRGRFQHLMSTKKLLVMAVLEENKLGMLNFDSFHDNFVD